MQLCRICGERLTKATVRQVAYSTRSYAERLEAAMMVTVTLDKEDIHPKQFCHKCYRAMTR